MLFSEIPNAVKTPLAAIIAYSQAITEGLVKEGQVDSYLEIIRHNSRALEEQRLEIGDDGKGIPPSLLK